MAFLESFGKSYNIIVLLLAVWLPLRALTFHQTAMDPISQPASFILDFDGTITTKDTIDFLFKSALSFHKEKGHDMTKAWQEIIAAYGQDYETHVGRYKPPKEERNTIEKEVEFYRSLREVEERSFERVSKSRIFKGISEEKWEELGSQAVKNGEVILREGFSQFIESVKSAKSRWGVVSVNFSSAFIRGVLGSIIGPESEEIRILANKPDEDGVLKGPKTREGIPGKLMATSDAKLASMNDLKRSWNMGANKVVYIGDSGTDIECLVSDGVIGIIISEDGKSSLMQTMRRIGMEVFHIGEYKEKARSIYWARDFLEIARSPLFK